ncbi:hypothetical protein KIN20_033578 [Parelaphostrongylus tenuis]|uniref:Polyadenylate-binding protein n=1 Tax=Parelaphostrongylus tenuis TaxID=148309 RepID=A0AAD5R8W1_PARTN|nr:hypothetical protein KIN20_033578 [Parelaphostrongylus tenuis]
MQRYQGVNLYVKNLDDAVDDETLRKHFETYGKITSAKVMTDENGRSKGYGFVCFEKADDATNAVAEMNSKWSAQNHSTSPSLGELRAQQFNPGAVHGGTRLAGQRFIQGSFAGQPQYTGPRPQLVSGSLKYQGKLTSAAKPGPAPLFQHYQQHTAQGVEIGGQVPLTTHMLAQAASQEQKQLLGERIYAVIEKMFPGHKEAGKITEMMLDIDNSELIMMLQDIDLLKSKVDEAASVLQSAAERN